MLAAATDSLAHLDMESLRNHAGQTSWLIYGMAIDALVAFHAQATLAQMTDLHSEASLFTARYGDKTLGTLSQDEFLMVLSGDHDLKPPVMRLPVIYRLLSWAAKQAGSALACPDLLPTDPPTPLPTNSVLTSAQWVKELRAHSPDGDGKLCDPGLLMRLLASKEHLRKERPTTRRMTRGSCSSGHYLPRTRRNFAPDWTLSPPCWGTSPRNMPSHC